MISNNNIRLRNLLEEVLLIDNDQYRDDYGPDEIETWDSLASVSIAAAIEKEFGYAMLPEEMASLGAISDLKEILRSQGFDFNQ